MDGSRTEREKIYREYRLLDLVIRPREPDLYEYAFLHGYLEAEDREELKNVIKKYLKRC